MMTRPRKDRARGQSGGRALEGRAGSPITTTRASLSSHQVEAIRNRIITGDYDAPPAVDALARRILDSGDL